MENTFQKQARELKEVRFESFKQGIFKERDRVLKLIKIIREEMITEADRIAIDKLKERVEA